MSHAARRPLVSAAVLLLAGPAAAQDHKHRPPAEMHRLHQDPEAYRAMLDDPKRDEYQKPHEVLMALDLRAGETVADI
ncbi:MAG TPA: hypothetical protein VFO85_13085, partial [Vicinamibacteria bacterium]|nr:hypothetical protein [Vicinamibacteria bacterium]